MLVRSCFFFSQEWIGNKIGVDDNVPIPWTPISIQSISANSYSVSCWGRKYTFDGSTLIKQIESLNEKVLSSPVTIKYGNSNSWKTISSKIIKQENGHAQFEFNSLLKQKNKQITNKTIIDIYYDGVIFYHIELSSTQDLSESIEINFSIQNNIARHIHRWKNSNQQNPQWWYSGEYPLFDKTNFIPYWWVGNQEKGLFWFAESPYNWINYKKNDAVNFSKRSYSDDASVVLNLTDINSYKSHTWTFEFGLQATPVKPMPNNWRSWQLGEIPESNINMIWPEVGKPYALKFFGYPEARNIDSFNSQVKKLKSENKKVLVYNALTYLSHATPEWKQFQQIWDIDALSDAGGDVRAYGADYSRINITDDKFQDFIVWKSYKFMKDTDIDGYYLDNCMITNINNKKEVRSFKSSSEKLPYFPIMESRKLFERFYKTVKSERSNKLVLAHSSARIVPPILGFSDAVIDGEQFRQQRTKVKGDYLEKVDLETFQSEFLGAQYGFPIIFLPVFDAIYYKTYYPTRYLAAILLQHDILVWPQASVYVVWSERYKLLSEFPEYETASFKAYYSNEKILSSDTKNVIGSVYKNNRNEYLCIVSNLNNIDFKGEITFTDSQHVLDYYKLIVKNGRNKSRISSSKSIYVEIKKQDYAAFYLLK